MKTARFPAIVFTLFLVGYVVFLCSTISLLPPRMATHFDAGGRPNAWGSRSTAVMFQGVMGLILPLIIASVFCLLKFVPTKSLNFPRRDFWFAPERRDATCAYLSQQGLWFACLLVGFQGVVWYQVIESNAKSIPHLSSAEFLITLGVFALSAIVWAASLFRHFGKSA